MALSREDQAYLARRRRALIPLRWIGVGSMAMAVAAGCALYATLDGIATRSQPRMDGLRAQLAAMETTTPLEDRLKWSYLESDKVNRNLIGLLWKGVALIVCGGMFLSGLHIAWGTVGEQRDLAIVQKLEEDARVRGG